MTTTIPAPTLDQATLDALLGSAVGDLGATISAGLVVLGDRLGLYRAMADGSAVTAEELADRTGTAVAYVRPWLANQAAGGYVNYADGSFQLSPEQSAMLGDPTGPAYFASAFELALGVLASVNEIAERFLSGAGYGWHEHDDRLFSGTERFFRAGYVANLVDGWLPALPGVVDRLTAGGRVADVGCGHGASTILMAQAFPRSTFIGTDYHEPSIVTATQRANEAGLSADRVAFTVADAHHLAAGQFDLITFFDCLHDMGDPVGAAAAARAALTPAGALMVVEPMAGDRLDDNLNPVGRVFYGASTLVCTPASLAQPGAAALGPQAGPARLIEVLHRAGFSRVRVATSTPFNLILDARR